MQRKLMIGTALVATAAIAAVPGNAASAKAKKSKRLACTIENTALTAPNFAIPSLTHLGFVSCPKPFGNGLHYNVITITKRPAPGVPGAATGKFKNYYNRGTTRGTVALTIVASSPMNITFSGTVKYTGGTGRFKRVKGGGTIVCTTTDGGAHKSCKVQSTLTGV